jgi:hypothetical protein
MNYLIRVIAGPDGLTRGRTDPNGCATHLLTFPFKDSALPNLESLDSLHFQISDRSAEGGQESCGTAVLRALILNGSRCRLWIRPLHSYESGVNSIVSRCFFPHDSQDSTMKALVSRGTAV